MPSPRTEPEYWQARAEEARAQADEMHSDEARQSMLEIAALYERVATLISAGRTKAGEP
jgi:hypothetical protein